MDRLPQRWLEIFPGTAELLARYRDLECRISRFKQAAGVDCLPGCGNCCSVPASRIEVSRFEMLPAAVRLWESGKAEAAAAELRTRAADAPCVFFVSAAAGFGGGHCTLYPLRPLLCRLFGFSAVRSKHGTPSFTFCKEIKHAFREAVGRISADPDLDAVVWMGAEAAAVRDLDPLCKPATDSINRAALDALETVLYRAELLGWQPEAGSGTDQDSPPRGRPPRLPRCA